MALAWKKTCLSLCGLNRHIACLRTLQTTRRKRSVPWYQELLDYNKMKKVKEGSILRNPGVVNLNKLSKEELCHHLTDNIVYRQGPLLAINKPQGLSVSEKQDEISVVSLLPDLQQSLQIKRELHVVKAAPRESSGLVLLSTCHVTTKHLEDFFSQCRKAKKPAMTFCAITVQVPDPREGEINVALKQEQIKDLNLVVPVMDPSKGSLERREVKATRTLYKVLDVANGCSLLQLQPMTVFRDQLLVQCVLKFCPVLGDHTYSSRIMKVLGSKIYVPFDLALPQTQQVDDKVLQKMHISSQHMHRMPLHLHLHKFEMPRDPPGRYPAQLQAPPPPFFLRTMELLGLKMKQ